MKSNQLLDTIGNTLRIHRKQKLYCNKQTNNKKKPAVIYRSFNAFCPFNVAHVLIEQKFLHSISHLKYLSTIQIKVLDII